MELRVQNIDLTRGTRLLQSRVGFELSCGEALWLRGPNGVGKSTLLETLCGFRRFERGHIFWQGVDVTQAMDPYQSEIAYCGHKNANASALTLEDALGFYAKLYDASGQKRDEAIEAMGLSARKNIPVHLLSAGQARRLALARLLLSNRKLWVLDEPSVSLDQTGARDLASHVQSHLGSGGMVIYTSHVELEIKARTLTLAPQDAHASRNGDAFAGEEWEGVA